MGNTEEYKLALTMVGLQFGFAGMNLFTRALLLKGLGSSVFVFYRLGIATLFIVLIAFATGRGHLYRRSLGLKSFAWIFLASFIGVAVKDNLYNEGLYLSSSTIASAMINLVPVITFLLAAILRLEKIKMKSLASFGKILGTIICVGGAISMSFLKGPKLLNTEIVQPPKSIFSLGGENWLLGCLLLFGCSCTWALLAILQVSVTANCPDHICSSSWMCFLATLESGIIALFVERDLSAWSLNSYQDLAICLYTGIVVAAGFYLQAWCTLKRGPIYLTMYNPLCTVILAFVTAVFLHEETYTGSLVGAFAVIIGFYIFLWGKAKDLEENKQDTNSRLPETHTNIAEVLTKEESFENNCRIDLEKPLLSGTSNKDGDSRMNAR